MKDAYLRGHAWGEVMKTSRTPKEVLRDFPRFSLDEVTVYLNGLEDALKGDVSGRDLLTKEG
jgi:hypothetical protein